MKQLINFFKKSPPLIITLLIAFYSSLELNLVVVHKGNSQTNENAEQCSTPLKTLHVDNKNEKCVNWCNNLQNHQCRIPFATIFCMEVF